MFLAKSWLKRSVWTVPRTIDTWMHDYNTTHSHSSLGYHTPEEFLNLYEISALPQARPARRKD
jgi:transposase InsO family protein